jgi:hypothetical protein
VVYSNDPPQRIVTKSVYRTDLPFSILITNTSLYSLRLYYYSLVSRNHLALPSEAESHFRAVCRALGTGTSLYSLRLYYYSLMSRNHLALPSEAESHFRAVCRALVSEALELSSFMEKVYFSSLFSC